MQNIIALPPALDNIKETLSALINNNDTDALHHLLGTELSEQDLIKIDRLPDDLKQKLCPQSINLSVISNTTTDFLLPILRATALRHGIFLETINHDYGQAMEFVMNPDSPLYDPAITGVLIAFDYHAFEKNDGAIEQIVRKLKKDVGHAPLFIQTVPNPQHMIFGNEERRQSESLRQRIANFNDFAAEHADYLIDIAYLAECIGLNHWYNDMYYHLAKIPFDSNHLPAYSSFVARSLALSKGVFGKCLVLDLDNTLWGGVIGDDGVENIEIGPGSPAGEAFLQFQRTILEYKNRGIILTICSKNEEDIARAAFREHSGMLLKEDDITLFVANWNDKASNIQFIADTLNIGRDSLVFVDDNPAEREQVRQALPMVQVLELPTDPSLYSQTLMFSGFLESAGVTEDDLKRTEHYAARMEAKNLLDSSDNYDDYLKTLEMVAKITPFDAMGRKRIHQLINKTNQFNLTTQRYTEAQVEAFETDTNTFTYQIHLADKFSEHGMISVIIAHLEGETLTIDSWLMSCRVLKRGLENLAMNTLIKDAIKHGVKTIIGTYRPTLKNPMVADFYERFGFQQISQETDDNTIWKLAVADYENKPTCIVQGD